MCFVVCVQVTNESLPPAPVDNKGAFVEAKIKLSVEEENWHVSVFI